MGEDDMVTEKPVENGNTELKDKVEKIDEVVSNKKVEQDEGPTEIEVDKGDEGKVEAQEMDVDKDAKEGIENQGGDEMEVKGGEDEEGKDEAPADMEMQDSKTEDGGNEKVKSVDNKEPSKETTGVVAEEIEEKVEEDVTELEKEEDKSEEPTAEDVKVEEPTGEENSEEHKSEEEKAEVQEPKTEEKETEEPKKGKGSTKRPRSKSGAGKNDKRNKKEPEEKEQENPTEKKKDPKASLERKDKEPKAPVTPTIDRPVRERKSVERLVAVIEQDNAKEFKIEKGRGVALKDIPNVAQKMSKKKTDENLKYLHTILFGRRGKAALVKNNILRFSGFVWHGNEEKQMEKVKDKLDKCVKEKLIDFCDVFDIPISKAHGRKEDVVAKLIEFLVEPKASSSDALAEKEEVGKKRKRGSAPSKGSLKISKGESTSKKGGRKSFPPGSESEDESEQGKEEGTRDSSDRSDNEMSKEAESIEKGTESDEDSDVDKAKKQAPVKSSEKKRSSAKKVSSEKNKSKNTPISKKPSPPPKKVSIKSRKDETSAKKSSGKKKEEPAKKSPTPKKPAAKDSTGKKVLKAINKPREETSKPPSDDDLRNATCEILKEVDFNTATFTDILKMLTTRFDADLTPRKAWIKIMIQDELTKMADPEEDEGEEADDDEKDEKKPSSSVTVKG